MLLGRYAQDKLDMMDEHDLDEFEALMQAEEPQLMAWLTGIETPADSGHDRLLADIRAYHASRPVALD